MKADISFFSGRPCHFLNPITTNPAFDIKSLFKKFLWISVILLFNLNLLIAYLIWAVFPLFSKLANTLRTDSFWAFDILSLSFSMLFSYLHLFKQSPTFALKFLNSWIKAFSLIWISLLSTKAISLTDLIAKFNEAKTEDTNLHSLSNLVFSVIDNHLL